MEKQLQYRIKPFLSKSLSHGDDGDRAGSHDVAVMVSIRLVTPNSRNLKEE
jgi:hypothetical protein